MTKTRMHARQPRSRLPRRNMRILTLRYRVIGLIRTWQAQPCGTYDPICYKDERVIAFTMETERRVLLTSRDLESMCYVRKGKDQLHPITSRSNLVIDPSRSSLCLRHIP